MNYSQTRRRGFASLLTLTCLSLTGLTGLGTFVSLAGPDQSEVVIGPDYKDAPEVSEIVGVPKGSVYEFTMDSKDSKYYPGIAKNMPGTVPYKRQVAVYVPQQYKPGTPAPFIVVQDGMGYRDVVSKTLNNLIAQKRAPAMIAIFVHNGGGDAQGSQRGLEYDTMSGYYAEFVENEVLPRVMRDYKVLLTKDPEGRATMGGSSGASAALSMAWYHPDLYHRVLSYSGTFVNQQWPANPETPHGAWEYHDGLIAKSKKKPIRIWMHVSENDLGSTTGELTYHNWVMANNRMAAVLKAKGYDYRYVFAKAAGHVDGRVTRQTLPEAMEWLWKGYKPSGQ